jgi:hypothetical protein
MMTIRENRKEDRKRRGKRIDREEERSGRGNRGRPEGLSLSL